MGEIGTPPSKSPPPLSSNPHPNPHLLSPVLNKLRGGPPSTKDRPFLHVKFGAGDRAPEFGHQHQFAHHIAALAVPSDPTLSEGLRTDVQRDGIGRYLTNNFKQGSPVWEVVRERERDESTYLLVLSNWHRSAGDQVSERAEVGVSTSGRRWAHFSPFWVFVLEIAPVVVRVQGGSPHRDLGQ